MTCDRTVTRISHVTKNTRSSHGWVISRGDWIECDIARMGILKEWEFNVSFCWYEAFSLAERTCDTASCCLSQLRSYWRNPDNERWPVRSYTIFSGTPAWYNSVAPVAMIALVPPIACISTHILHHVCQGVLSNQCCGKPRLTRLHYFLTYWLKIKHITPKSCLRKLAEI